MILLVNTIICLTITYYDEQDQYGKKLVQDDVLNNADALNHFDRKLVSIASCGKLELVGIVIFQRLMMPINLQVMKGLPSL